MHNPNKYLQYIDSLNKEAREKKKRLAREQIAEGYIKISDFIRKKTFT